MHDINTYVYIYPRGEEGEGGIWGGTADEFNQVVSMISHCIGCAATFAVIQYTINSILDFICKTSQQRECKRQEEQRKAQNRTEQNRKEKKGKSNHKK